MASLNTIISKLINVNNVSFNDCTPYTDNCGLNHLSIHATVHKKARNICPYCGRKCPGYDVAGNGTGTWRSLDFGSTIVEITAETNRICCPEHGIVTAAVPWAYPKSRFTKEFDLTVAWLAKYLPRSTVSSYMRIDWVTVGKCISRTLNDIEPIRERRLNNLVRIGIDETSYRKGHKYITIVVNHDTNCVVWIGKGHGKGVLTSFFECLTPEQRESIEIVTGDGASWITDCAREYLPNIPRCVDPFHVVEWANEAVDSVRKDIWHEANEELKKLTSSHKRGRGKPSKDDQLSKEISAAKEAAKNIKNSVYALGKAPEHLTESQQIKLDLIASQNPVLFRAYGYKERLRLILKIKDIDLAKDELKKWMFGASHSRIPAIVELYRKIKRNKEFILNAIEYGMSNARIEATNTKIKLIVRKAYGFRNFENMTNMIYLVCSDLHIPLPNRFKKCQKVA